MNKIFFFLISNLIIKLYCIILVLQVYLQLLITGHFFNVGTHIASKISISNPVTFLDVPIKSSLVEMFLLVNQPTTI